MDNYKIQRLNEFRKICLRSSEELLTVAESALQLRTDQIAFHLSTLALEEIGKIYLLQIRLASELREGGNDRSGAVDDHEKKLFLAIWGRTLGQEKITGQQIRQYKGLASSMHNRRLSYLYADPDNPVSWQEKMKAGEGKLQYELARDIHKLETEFNGLRTDLSSQEIDEQGWFIKSSSDPKKRKELWGNESQEKLIELGSVQEWIRWHIKNEQDNEKKMMDLVRSELSRNMPKSEKEMWEPKWRIKLRIISDSHSIRNKSLAEFNRHSEFVRMHKVRSNELLLELRLTKGISVHKLWNSGWEFAKLFVTALNVGTRGIFWWNLPVHTSKYYDEMWDLENNNEVEIKLDPPLSLNQKQFRHKLSLEDLGLTVLVFNYITNYPKNKNPESLNHYIRGISLLAKNDIHLRVEAIAFMEFFRALETALGVRGWWKKKRRLKNALEREVGVTFKDSLAGIDKHLDLAFKLKNKRKAAVTITVDDVIGMKNYCDVYYVKAATDYVKDLQIGMSSEGSQVKSV